MAQHMSSMLKAIGSVPTSGEGKDKTSTASVIKINPGEIDINKPEAMKSPYNKNHKTLVK